MGLLSKILHSEPVEPALEPSEQATIVCLKLSDDEMGSCEERQAISLLRDNLIRAVQERDAGEFDTLEYGEGFGTLTFNGTSADRLAAVVLPVVQAYPLQPGSYLVKRYGEEGAREQSVVLGAHA
ncbi:MAG TPA: hypothetical protein VKB87_12365 [Myxococcaceae bacterium]|nr:hypothetical protein [Myxococcaceae bacterium]